jgi:hypothetical protein
VVVVKPVRVESLSAGVRVEMQLLASKSSPLIDKPVQQCSGMALASSTSGGREIIDV